MSISIELPEVSMCYVVNRFSVKSDTFSGLNKTSGVYVIYGNSDRVLYVGKSKNLGSRLLGHSRGKYEARDFYRDIERIDVYMEKNLSFVDIYETHAIGIFKPEYNKDKVHHEERYIAVSDRLSDIEAELVDIDYEIEDYAQSLDEDNDEDAEYLGDCLFIAQQIRGLERKKALLKRELAVMRRRSAG